MIQWSWSKKVPWILRVIGVVEVVGVVGLWFGAPLGLTSGKVFAAPSVETISPTQILEIINAGLEVWNLIEQGRPSGQLQSSEASALPQSMEAREFIQGWQGPVINEYRLVYRNKLGIHVVDFRFSLSFLYGGHIEGKGRYLKSIRVIPVHVQTLWGYKTSARASVPSLVNLGSHDAPIAGAEILIHITVASPVMSKERYLDYFIRGDSPKVTSMGN